MNLRINHRLGIVDISFFNDFSLNMKYDSIASTFGFSFYFDPTNQQHAELACVSHFHEVIVEHEGERLATGYMLSNEFTLEPKKQLVKIGGYSKSGVFEDCEIPTSMYPLQSDGLTLRQIAKRFTDKFKLKLVVESIAVGAASTAISLGEKLDAEIEKTNATESQNIKSYLAELAMQRNIILSHDEYGNLVFTQAKTNKEPLFHVEKGVIARSIEMKFNGQGMHSQIEAIRQADEDGGNEGYAIVYNPYCPIVFRPRVVVQNSGDDSTIAEFARAALAQELKNIRLEIIVDRWKVNEKIIKPNNIITVLSPENFIYNKTKFFIEEVRFTGNSDAEVATLICVPPEAYDRKTAKNIFVNPHENLPRTKAQ